MKDVTPIRALKREAGGNGGFTFFEIVMVILILGFLYSIGSLSLRGVLPKYRLRTAARDIGTAVEQQRLSAVSRGRWLGIHYVLTPLPQDNPDKAYYQLIPPPPDDYPDQPLAMRELGVKHELPDRVRIARVLLAGNQVVDRGSVSVLFSPMGNAGSHITILEGENERFLAVKVNCITGSIEFIESADVAFQHFEG